MKMRISVLSIFLYAVIFCLSLPVSAAIIYVDDDSTCTTGCGSAENPFAVIQDGVDAALSEDTVLVAAGTYPENILISEPLTLRSDEDAVITATELDHAITINSDSVTISGFTVIGISSKHGIQSYHHNNCVIVGNTISGSYYGITITFGNASGTVTITGNEITGNNAGIYLPAGGDLSDMVNITGNLISNNGRGLSMNNFIRTLTLTDNTFDQNNESVYAPYTIIGGTGYIYNNNFYDTLMTVSDPYGMLIWHNGYAGGGNYWSDWTAPDDYSGPDQDIPGADGYVDLPRGDDLYPFVMADGWNDKDGDGYLIPVDCDDNDPAVYPGAPETKHDGIDQDCNGYDLTIDITKANYDSVEDSLRVEAISSLGATANLELTNYGSMTWRDNQQDWIISVDPAGGNPGTITVCGIEGCESAPVIAE